MNHEMFSSKIDYRTTIDSKQDRTKKPCYYSCVYKFNDIEHIISVSHRLTLPFFDSKLISYNNAYYLSVLYPENRVIRTNDWAESMILEYGVRSYVSIHRLEEYGNTVISNNAIATVRDFFVKI